MDKLGSELDKLAKSDFYPFHMPGHKRRPIAGALETVCTRDITEIDGFDNLHCPEGIIREEQHFAANLFGAQESFFLVNGSSCGVLAAIATVAQNSGNSLLIGRNVHKSAYHGLYLTGMEAVYLYPEKIEGVSFAGPVRLESVAAACKNIADYNGIFITSPTYEGIVSDIKEICEMAHQKGVPVIVDEAHGAHLGIWGGDDYFPSSALAQGADIVIQSLHKTLPAMTQTAILHVQGDLIDRQKLKRYLAMFQSSSPSYILMESITSCLHFCSEHRESLLEKYRELLQDFYQNAAVLSHLRVIESSLLYDASDRGKKVRKDPGKIIISTGDSRLSGKELYTILREQYHLQMEMTSADYVIAMTSVMDTKEGFERLFHALWELDQKISAEGNYTKGYVQQGLGSAPAVVSSLSVKDALDASGELMELDACIGRISQEFAYLYPPGIPFLVPGEIISRELLQYLEKAVNQGLSVQGLQAFQNKQILCVKNKENK